MAVSTQHISGIMGNGPRAATAAGVAYTAAWLVGLLAAPAAPSVDASAAEVHRWFGEHSAAATAQSLLVHGVAGGCLAVVVVAVGRWLGGRAGSAARVLGLAAVAVSLAQVALMGAIAATVAEAEATTTAGAFDAINYADSVKLLLLGGLVAVVTVASWRGRCGPAWLRWLGAVLAPLLPVSGAAFLLHSQTLYAALYASLPLLLLWVAASAIVARRRTA